MATAAAAAAPWLRTRLERLPDAVFGFGVCVAIVSIAAANGGYFPTSWGWSALVFSWATLLALLVGRNQALSVEGAVFLVATLALTGWTFASAIWSWDAGDSILEGERALVYASAVAALLLLARGRTHILLGSLLTGITLVCAYSLATRLLPDRFGRFDSTAIYRLANPLGYWNSLGLFAAIGTVLAVGFVGRGRSLIARALAGAAPVVLVTTMFFTFSRGAWLSLGTALAFLLVLDPRRLQASLALAGSAPAPAITVWLAYRSHALTTVNTPLRAAIHGGHRLIVALVLLAVLGAGLALLFAIVERRWSPVRSARLAYGALLVLALAVSIAAVTVHWGSPPTLAKRVWHSFEAPPRSTANLNQRLFQFSSNGRLDLWRSAINEYQSAPVAGTGAGTFEFWWQQHRTQAAQVVDAHSLYAETLGELGIVGLALLLLALVAALVGGIRARAQPLVPFAAAGFVAWAVHAGVDWDWEIAAVTLVGLACGVALVVDRDASEPRRRLLMRFVGGAVAVAVAAFALVAIVGNQALSNAESALQQGHPLKAEKDARRAKRWMPWSGEPPLLIGEIEARSGRRVEGLRDIRRATAKEPHYFITWYALANAERGAVARVAAAHVVHLNPLSDEAAEMRQLLAKRP